MSSKAFAMQKCSISEKPNNLPSQAFLLLLQTFHMFWLSNFSVQ